MEYALGHRTDDILGRKGATIDWSQSILGFDAKDRSNFIAGPPKGWDWQGAFGSDPLLIARSAVKPFALFHVHSINLVLLSEAMWQSVRDFSGTLTRPTPVGIRFGTKKFRTLPYIAAELLHAAILDRSSFAPANTFFAARFDLYYRYGTSVERGEASPGTPDGIIAKDLQFDSFEAFAQTRKEGIVCGQHAHLYLQSVAFKTPRPPLIFGTPTRLYCAASLAERISEQPTPGICFPYPPIPRVV